MNTAYLILAIISATQNPTKANCNKATDLIIDYEVYIALSLSSEKDKKYNVDEAMNNNFKALNKICKNKK